MEWRPSEPRALAVYLSLASWLPARIARNRAANAVAALLLNEALGRGASANWPDGTPRFVLARALRRSQRTMHGHTATRAAVDAAARSFELAWPVMPHDVLSVREREKTERTSASRG